MNQTVKPAAALRGSTAVASTAILALDDRRKIAIDALMQNDLKTMYSTVHRIEDMSQEAFDVYPADKTALKPIIDAFNSLEKHGVKAPITLGGGGAVLHPDLPPDKQKDKIHDYLCYCGSAMEQMSGQAMVNLLNARMDKAS